MQICTLKIAHADFRVSAAISLDGTRLASVSGLGSNLVQIWNTATGALVSSFVGVRFRC